MHKALIYSVLFILCVQGAWSACGKGEKNLVKEYITEQWLNSAALYPLAGMSYVQTEFQNAKWDIKKVAKNMEAFRTSPVLMRNNMPKPVAEIKAVAYLLNQKLVKKSFSKSLGIMKGLDANGIKAINSVLATSGQKIQIEAANSKVISMRMKKTSRTHLSSFWWSKAMGEGFLFHDVVSDPKMMTGAHILENNGVVSFTAIYTTSTSWYTTKTVKDLSTSVSNCIGLSSQHVSEGAAFRENARKQWDAENLRYGIELNNKEAAWMKIARPFNNPYYLVGELKLMRRYPQILRSWLLKQDNFKKNNPNYKPIMEYLKTAKRRPAIDAWCQRMDFEAWAQAWYGAKDGQVNTTGVFDQNFVQEDSEFGIQMMEHAKSRFKVTFKHVWVIDNLQCNDWGPYQLITEYFLKHPDPRVWKWLLTDDVYGVQNVAMGSARHGNTFRVGLIWYDSVENSGVPTFTQGKYGQLKSGNCINQYNFRQRRCYKYDKGCGWPTKPGEGETGADKPQPNDPVVPGQKPKKDTKPFSPPGTNPDCKKFPEKCPKKDPKKAAKKTKKVKKPKVQPKLPPPQQRVKNDKRSKTKTIADLAVRQVIDFARSYAWVK